MNQLYLKQLRLVNFCQYVDETFSFMKPDGTPYRFVGFFGPNGTGKTNLLHAIDLLKWNWANRGYSMVDQEEAARNSLRKFVRNLDYDPAYERVKDYRYKTETYEQFEKNDDEQGLPMLIEGVFVLDGKEYVVQLTDHGYARNDFAPVLNDPEAEDDEIAQEMCTGPWGEDHLKFRQRMIYMVTTDSDLSLNKFQLHYPMVEGFERIVEQIVRFPVKCDVPKGINPYDRDYCTDVVFEKPDRAGNLTKAHYKRLSAGERKICKSFSQLFNMMFDLEYPEYGEDPMPGWPPLLLIDNVEMHVYYDRHVTFIRCAKEVFDRQQVFVTTHSGVLVPRFKEGRADPDELWIDLEPKFPETAAP